MRPPESFIEQPIRSLQTMLRVIAEDDRSLPTVVPDGIYGPGTMTCVSAFQRHCGLPVTGVTDQQTWEAIAAAYEPAITRVGKAEPIEIIMDPGQVFCKGDTSPYVFLLQGMLTQLSLDHAAINAPGNSGVMDIDTQAAVAAFQQLAQLPVTGEVDKITWKYIVRHFTLNAHHNSARYKRGIN